MTRIAIAHSLPREKEVLRRIIASRPGLEIAWLAADGTEAIEKAARDTPDILLLDLMLHDATGAQPTAAIMKSHPCAILLVAPSSTGTTARIFDAMGNGALDVVGVPFMDSTGRVRGEEELLKKISIIEKLIRKENGLQGISGDEKGEAPALMEPIVAIGSSTGGPKALAEILSRLMPGMGLSIVVVQHLDVQFAAGLVEWLGQQTRLRVLLAQPGMVPEPETVFVAGTNDHLILTPERTFRYVAEPKDYPYRPSVDRFFLSARDCWPEKGVAVLLTGMGRDGAKGLLALRKAGWHTIAQDEATSVVHGMPKAAIELGAAVEVLGLEKISDAITAQITMKEGFYIHE